MRGSEVTAEVLRCLQVHAEPGFVARQQAYSKDAFKSLGLRTAHTHQVAKETYFLVKPLAAEDLLAECDALWEAGYWEMALVAIDWCWHHRKQLGTGHWPHLRGWLEGHVHTWQGCDHLCGTILGEILRNNPSLLAELPAWAASENKWMRRGAAVVMIPSFRKSAAFLPVLLQIATSLLADTDDMVQKGYGWALKEACKHAEQVVFEFVMQHKAHMPRTALRYAIENMPQELKALAMAKN